MTLAAAGRSFVLSDEDFARVRAYLAATVGLEFEESRRGGLALTLAERMCENGAQGVEEYLAGLDRPGGESERQRLIDGVTVRETFFFRNPPQVEALRRRILPDLLRRAVGRDRPLTIWSAGCSTGEEAYGLAMSVLELAPWAAPDSLDAQPAVRIVATDVSAQALRAADQATYAGRTLENVPAAALQRWFQPEAGGAFAVRDDVRRLVELRAHNLVTQPPPFRAGEVDLVVCRNVTIYFSPPTTRMLVGRFHDVLAEGGYLLLGHSETLWQVSDAFTLVPVADAFVYRRMDATPAEVAAPVHPRAPAPARALPTAPVTPAAGGDPLAEAWAALGAGDYAEAERLAEVAVLAEELRAEAYVVLGHARVTLGLHEGAVHPLRKAVYLEPTDGHAYFLLASALACTGRHDAAAISYRAAAHALGTMSPEPLMRFLSGRSVGDLVETCERLARLSAEAAADDVVLASGRGGAR